MSEALLDALRPLRKYIDDPKVEEISINGVGKGKVFIERCGRSEAVDDGLDRDQLDGLCSLVANFNRKGLSFESPILSGVLPGGERIEIAIPPVSREPALSIRCPRAITYELAELANAGLFVGTKLTRRRRSRPVPILPDAEAAAAADDAVGLLRALVLGQRTMLVSGPTFSGKTTVLKALARFIPDDLRIVTMEDTSEVTLQQPNYLQLFTAGTEAKPIATMPDLLRSSLRHKPRWVMLGEIRGKEAYTWLAAANTGHAGAATIHAASAEDAKLRLVQCAMEYSEFVPYERLMTLVEDYCDVFIHVHHDKNRPEGSRFVQEILWV